ncbi:MAG: hypothetical protein HW416_2239 [Chloroflexi bacterium]|nr:hypothetical protein [Chloroflexota bacterium]
MDYEILAGLVAFAVLVISWGLIPEGRKDQHMVAAARTA